MSDIESACATCGATFDNQERYAAHLVTAHLLGGVAPDLPPVMMPDGEQLDIASLYTDEHAVEVREDVIHLDGPAVEAPLVEEHPLGDDYEEVQAILRANLERDPYLDEGADERTSPAVAMAPPTSSPSDPMALPSGFDPSKIDPSRIYDPDAHDPVALRIVAVVMVLLLLVGAYFVLR